MFESLLIKERDMCIHKIDWLAKIIYKKLKKSALTNNIKFKEKETGTVGNYRLKKRFQEHLKQNNMENFLNYILWKESVKI